MLVLAAAPAHASASAELIVAGIPGAVYGADRTACGSFVVAAAGKPVPNVIVSATGIDVWFAKARVSASDLCPQGATAIARLGTVSASGVTVFYRVAGGAFPPLGDTATGTIRVASPDSPSVEVPVVLRHSTVPGFPSALDWLVGLTVPPFIAALIGVGSALIALLFYRSQKRIEQQEAAREKFKTYKIMQRATLEGFFTGVYRQIGITYNKNRTPQGEQDWRRNLRFRLRQEHLWENIPWEHQDALARDLDDASQERPDDIAARLARVFAPFETSITPLSAVGAPEGPHQQ